MIKRLLLFLTLPLTGMSPEAQEAAEPFYTVSYVEVETSSRSAAVSRLQTYEAAVPGDLRFELFEERDRLGHFVIIETWPSAAAFEAAAPAREALGQALQPIRVSDYDQRPYHALAPDPASSEEGIYVVAHVDVSPNPDVPVLLRQHADQSRQDPGNLRFEVLQHNMRANHFTVIEAWDTLAAYQQHVEANHTRAYRDQLGPFLGSPLDQRLYTAVY